MGRTTVVAILNGSEEHRSEQFEKPRVSQVTKNKQAKTFNGLLHGLVKLLKAQTKRQVTNPALKFRWNFRPMHIPV
jgi:hypothetical protein